MSGAVPTPIARDHVGVGGEHGATIDPAVRAKAQGALDTAARIMSEDEPRAGARALDVLSAAVAALIERVDPTWQRRLADALRASLNALATSVRGDLGAEAIARSRLERVLRELVAASAREASAA